MGLCIIISLKCLIRIFIRKHAHVFFFSYFKKETVNVKVKFLYLFARILVIRVIIFMKDFFLLLILTSMFNRVETIEIIGDECSMQLNNHEIKQKEIDKGSSTSTMEKRKKLIITCTFDNLAIACLDKWSLYRD